jgi:hypothetical protein
MIGFGNRAGLLDAVGRARRIELSSWLLPQRNPLVAALEAAGDRGADVRVTLEAEPFVGDPNRTQQLEKLNADTICALRRHHVDARLTEKGTAPLHLKAAVVDGRAYLAERNWTADETIVTTTDERDAAAIASAIEERPHDTPDVALRKDRALALEAALIREAPPGTAIECATESFGKSCVSDALLERARRGEKNMRLLLNAGALTKRSNAEPAQRSDELRASAQTLAALRAAGVRICLSKANEKFCVAGQSAWLGSANATEGEAWTIDWGMRTDDPSAIARLRARFEESWGLKLP